MYQLDDLLLFAIVVENKSFLKTALQLNISQPTVGRRIKLLAENLGYELFISDGNHLTVTAFGNMLYRIVKQKMSYLDDLKSTVNELILNTNPEEAGHLNILLPPASSLVYFTPLIPKFNLKYPNITLYINYGTDVVDFSKHNYDVAIVAYVPAKDTLPSIKLLDASTELYCTKAYAEKYGLPNTVNDLQSHRIFSVTKYGKLLDSVDFIHKSTAIVETFIPNNQIVLTDIRNALKLIKSNEFIGPCQDFLCNSDPSIIKALPEYYILDVPNKLYLLKNNYKKNPLIDLFTDFVQKELKLFVANSRISSKV